MPFEFATANRIIFGSGSQDQIGALAKSFGERALLVTGSNLSRVRTIVDSLADSGVVTATFSVNGEPSIETAREGVMAAREHEAQVIIGVGGGAALDAGKAIAALLTNPGDPLDYLEVIGRGKKLANVSAPYIAMPTTAGTGAEVTMNAVLSSKEHRVKVSLRSPSMLPRIALVDPQLAIGLPAAITARTGMDALTQVIEPFVSNKANPLTDAIALEGLRHGSPALRRVMDGIRAGQEDLPAREAMALASLCGGLALANAKLGAVHGFAAPIGGMYDAPHGAICAILLPEVIRVNLRALRERDADHVAVSRYEVIARIVTGRDDAQADDAVAWAENMVTDFAILRLSSYGITQADLPDIVEKAAVASSMQGNPIRLTSDELTEILEAAL